jgi:CheY-like chemotaxis protein
MVTPKDKRRILCVDDNLMLAELCEERLRGLGYEATGEADGEKALQLLKESPEGFDLLIVDHVMPKVGGTELAKRALTIQPDINVLLVIGYEGAVSEEEAREVGVREVLAKPFTTAEFAAAIKRILA